MKYLIAIFFTLLTMQAIYAQQDIHNNSLGFSHGRLMVAKNDPHFLCYADGKPFFWLGDTGWEMIHLLNRQEIRDYLETRKAQGFNVIQTVVLSEFDGLTKPNAYWSLPLINKNPALPAITPGNNIDNGNEYDYWDHLDFAVNEAEQLGIYLALLPCWGEYVVPREGNAIFHNTDQAYNYGNFLGKRYQHKQNIIWILGGDRLPDEIPDGIKLWRAMAKGIADGTNGINSQDAKTDYSTTLMTYHCSQSSSTWFQKDEWLDFNMWGSYHDNFSNTKAFEQVLADHALPTIKPTINGEPAYEEHPVNWLENNGVFTAYDVRQIAYWSVFAGAFGHTYGCNPVWQFYDTARHFSYFAHTPWKKALTDDGAVQLKYLKQLMLSRPIFNRRLANDIVKEGQGTGMDKCIATAGDGYAFVFLPTGKPVKVELLYIGDSIKAWWFNPRNGEAKFIGDFTKNDMPTFAPPGISPQLNWLKTGRGCDWVLVLDDKNKAFPPPGAIQNDH